MNRTTLAAALLLPAAASCVYYNGMWSARRLAREGEKHEARGETAEARLAWARAAVKAESVRVHHPRSGWADDALVLEGEGRARSGACADALAPLEQALASVSEPALRERAALARGDADGASALLTRSQEPVARAVQAQALIAGGRGADVPGFVGRRLERRADESAWLPVFDALAAAVGAESASAAVERFVTVQSLRAGARARFLLADGDRLLAAGAIARAAARYEAAARLVPDSSEGQRARVRAVRAAAAGAAGPADLAVAHEALRRL